MCCPTVATMATPTGTRAAARVRAGLAVVLMIAATALTGAGTAAAGTAVRTVEERLQVPAGPGEAGTIGLDTTLYLPATTPRLRCSSRTGSAAPRPPSTPTPARSSPGGSSSRPGPPAGSAPAGARSRSTRRSTRSPTPACWSTGWPPGPRSCRTGRATRAWASPAVPTAARSRCCSPGTTAGSTRWRR